LRTSAVAACCSRASASSRVSRATSVSLLKAEGRKRRFGAGFDAALRFTLIVCCVFAGLRLLARRRFTWPSLRGRPQPSTAAGGLCSTAKQGGLGPNRVHRDGQPRQVTSAYPPKAAATRTCRHPQSVP